LKKLLKLLETLNFPNHSHTVTLGYTYACP
jgi:hypothetical protein